MANYGKDINKIYPGKTCTKPKSLNKHKVVIKNINPEIEINFLKNANFLKNRSTVFQLKVLRLTT